MGAPLPRAVPGQPEGRYRRPMPRFSLVPAAYVALLRDGEVLLQQRQNTGYMDGYWSFSAAGHIERGESVTAAAVREAREELGVHIEEADLEPVCTIHRRQNDRDGGQRVDFYFAVSRWEGEPHVKETHRSGGLTWAPLSALPEPMVPVDAMALRMLAADERQAIAHWGF